MEGLPNPLCQAQGGLSYFFSLASAFLCVALSIASFRLTRGKPFVSNSLGAVAVYVRRALAARTRTHLRARSGRQSLMMTIGEGSFLQRLMCVSLCQVLGLLRRPFGYDGSGDWAWRRWISNSKRLVCSGSVRLLASQPAHGSAQAMCFCLRLDWLF